MHLAQRRCAASRDKEYPFGRRALLDERLGAQAGHVILTCLLSIAGPAHADLAATCAADQPALIVTLDGDPWPERPRATLETQIAIEAQRLSLFACLSSDGPPRAEVRATLDANGIKVEVTTSTSGTTRRLERLVPRARLGAPELATELAFVIGELVGEALHNPPAPPPPPPAAPIFIAPAVIERPAPPRRKFALGARAASEVFSTVFVGLDLVGRARLAERWQLELSATGRMTPSGTSALGTASAFAIGGGLGLGFAIVSTEDVTVLVELGARASALRLSATAEPGAQADEPAWQLQVHALGGLAVSYFVAPSTPLVLRAGAAIALRGVAVLAESEEVLSSKGAGGFVSLGSEGWF